VSPPTCNHCDSALLVPLVGANGDATWCEKCGTLRKSGHDFVPLHPRPAERDGRPGSYFYIIKVYGDYAHGTVVDYGDCAFCGSKVGDTVYFRKRTIIEDAKGGTAAVHRDDIVKWETRP
jgi:hypothetical protein